MDARMKIGSYATSSSSARLSTKNKQLQGLVFTVLALLLFVWTSYQIIQGADLALSRLLQRGASSKQKQEQEQEPVLLPKVLFWTLTVDCESNRRKVAAIRDTWGQRHLDKLLLISNGTKLGLRPDNVTLNVITGLDSRDQSWLKVSAALRYLHANHLHQFQWFMKTDDDTYVLVDRLKHFLAAQSHQWPIYFGHKFTKYIKQGYMSGGSGYVLSRRALDLIVREGLDKELDACRLDNSGVEDVEIGSCLEAVGVRAQSSNDSLGRPRFLPLSPEQLLSTTDAAKLTWYPDYSSVHPLGLGRNCCSADPISFHYMKPEMMRLVDWLLYVVKRPLSQDTTSLTS